MADITKAEILDFVSGAGADICGAAELGGVKGYIEETYGDYFASFPTAISFALFFPKEVVQEQLEGPTHTYPIVYSVLNREIDRISALTAVRLQKAGFRAYPVPASDYRQSSRAENLHRIVGASDNADALPKVGFDKIGVFSHRIAAALAGLGWVGKSCSIINPKVGPRMRLGTILTDAPFEGDGPMESRCGNCTLCMRACPVNALHGREFKADEPLEARFDVDRCYDFWDDIGKVFGVQTCGLCLAACPWGM